MEPVRRLRLLSVGSLLLTMAAGACSSSPGGGAGGTAQPTGGASSIAAEVASVDLYAGTPQRFLVGMISADNRFVTFGRVHFAFAYTGTAGAPTSPQPGPEVDAAYVPTPGTPAHGDGPRLSLPSDARGVYQAEGVTFERAGIWQVTVTADVRGAGPQSLVAAFAVGSAPALPAPGQPALRTDNLTIHSKDAPIGAIDSRAETSGKIPDRNLHEWTIAKAIAEGRPALVVFATPVYCVSQFCGPATNAVEALSKRYADRAVFIHVEIWRDYQNQVVNKAAADWLYRNNDLTEPWVFLIGPDGKILDRWGSLWDPREVAQELMQFPKMA